MRIFTILAFVLSLVLFVPLAQAAGSASSARAVPNSPLKPGKWAGVRRAQQARAGVALIGAGAIIAVVIVAAGSSNGNGNPQTNTQSVTTTP